MLSDFKVAAWKWAEQNRIAIKAMNSLVTV